MGKGILTRGRGTDGGGALTGEGDIDQGGGGEAEESKPPRSNEGGRRSADWVRNERPLSSEPFAQGLREWGTRSHGVLLPALPSLQGLQGAERGT